MATPPPARSVVPSLAAAGTPTVLVPVLLAFLSGVQVRRRVVMNLVDIAAAVGVTYLIGTVTRALWGISV